MGNEMNSVEEKLAFAKELGDIVQIGIVVEDMEKTKQAMRTIFGLESEAGGESLYRGCLYRTEGETVDAPVISAFYNFFNMIPKSLDEAAMIDGAGALKVFYHVAIRLSLSTILVVFMFAFVFNWNETYSTSTLMRNSIELVPNQLTLFDNNLTTSDVGSVNEASKMAATLISIAPLLLLYALVQRQFIEGIENAGITGE